MTSLFQIVPNLADLRLDSKVGFYLPEYVQEESILNWINERHTLLQYNDCDSMVLDTREMGEEQIASPLSQPMGYLPYIFVVTYNLFAAFCDFFDISLEDRALLNTVSPNQSVAIINHPNSMVLAVFPYFKNINYLHADVCTSMTLRKLMELQDQALILNCDSYPFINDMNTSNNYVESSSPPSDKKRKRETDEDFMDIDGDQDDDDFTETKMQCIEWSMPVVNPFERVLQEENYIVDSADNV